MLRLLLPLLSICARQCAAGGRNLALTMFFHDQSCRQPVSASVTTTRIGDCTPHLCQNGTITQCVSDYTDTLEKCFDQVPTLVKETFASDNCTDFISAEIYLADGICHVNPATNDTTKISITANGSVSIQSNCSSSSTRTRNVTSGVCVNSKHIFTTWDPRANQTPGSESQSGYWQNDEDGATAKPKMRKKDERTNTSWIVGVVATLVFVVAIGAIMMMLYAKRKRQRFVTTNDVVGVAAYPSMMSPKDSFLSTDPMLIAHRCNVADLKDQRLLGRGGFCNVWLVLHRGVERYASKRLRERDPSKNQVLNFVKEIKLIASLVHPRIVQFKKAAWTNDYDLQALFEYMDKGDLRSWLRAPTTPRQWTTEKYQIAIDVCEALVFVHSFAPPIVHRDLKSSNVLLDRSMRAKLGDFGIARVQSTQATMTIGLGTMLWLAPEVVSGRRDYDQRCDIFAFGVVLSEIDTHEPPYSDLRNGEGSIMPNVAIAHRVATGTITPSFSPSCPPGLLALAKRCVSFQPEDRPSAREVLRSLVTISKSQAQQRKSVLG